eukprot:1337490-Prymnesium_polylepis.1
MLRTPPRPPDCAPRAKVETRRRWRDRAAWLRPDPTSAPWWATSLAAVGGGKPPVTRVGVCCGRSGEQRHRPGRSGGA